MAIAAIHPNWSRPPATITEGYSLEMTAKDRPALVEAAGRIAPETPVAITFLPGETVDARIAAAAEVRALGFEPMPHLSARRIASVDELEQTVRRTVAEAGAKRVFLVAGDPPVPAGPFPDVMSMLKTGIFEANGISAVGIAGHPEGHPAMTEAQCWDALDAKRGEITARGIDCPVRVGVPGPAGIKTLLRFAAHCGVGASAAVMLKYGVSITQLLGTAGPDKLVDALAARLGAEHGPVRLHFYPFGGLGRTVDWINDHEARAR